MSDEQRDRAAEAWLQAQHDEGWYLGSASVAEWETAYAVVDALRAERRRIRERVARIPTEHVAYRDDVLAAVREESA